MIDLNAPATQEEMDAILGRGEGDVYLDTPETRRNPMTGRIVKHYNDGSDEELNVQFTIEPVYHKLKSHRAGVPQYVDMEFISIFTPLSKDTIHTPVTEYHKWRFPKDYAAFKQGQGELVSGTPLALWPLLSQSQIKELSFQNIRTVEQIANLSDGMAGKVANFHTLKRQAQQFIELGKDKAEQAKLQVELDQRDAEHKAQLATMQAQMDNLMRMLEKKMGEDTEPKVDAKGDSKPARSK